MMICVYVDGVPAPLTADLQLVAESLLDVERGTNRRVDSESRIPAAVGRDCGVTAAA
jgi:hypothetical protein